MTRVRGPYRHLPVLSAVAVLVGLTPSVIAQVPPDGCPAPGVDDTCEAWSAAYDEVGPSSFSTLWLRPHVAAGRDRVFATGQFRRPQDGLDPFVTVAYDQATGAELWVARRQRDPDAEAYANDIALAPDEDVLFAAGSETLGVHPNRTTTALLVAYDAATGAELWEATYDEGPGGEAFSAVAVSLDGATVYTAGAAGSPAHVVVAAYDATTGAPRWVDTHGGSAGQSAGARDLAVAPDGTRVFVTSVEGLSYYPAYRGDILTLAYDDDDDPGTLLWTARYAGPSGKLDEPAGMAVGPDGGLVFVTGTRDQDGELNTAPEDFVTVAYDTRTGAETWISPFDGPGAGFDRAESMAVSPTGDRLYVTGVTTVHKADGPLARASVQLAMATVAYDAATGGQNWASFAGTPADVHAWGRDVTVSPDGTHIYTTGQGSRFQAFSGMGNATIFDTPIDFVTVAHDAGGTQRWVARFNSRTAGLAPERAGGIAVRPDGGRVFVVGYLGDPTWGPNRKDQEAALGTVAYDTG